MTAQAEQQGVPKKNTLAITTDSWLRDFTRMNPPIYTRSKIAENLEEECRVDILHASMGLSRLTVHVEQLQERMKRKHTRAGNMSRHAEKNFSRKSSTEIRDKPSFKKEYPTKGSQVHPRVAMIGIPSLELRETVK